MNKNTCTNIQPTTAIVYIAGKKLDFFSLRLEQTLGEHHHFSIETDFAALEQSLISKQLDFLKLPGQTINIDLLSGDDNADTYKFRGVLQHIAMERRGEIQEYLTIRGASLTTLMEGGRSYSVLTNLTLKEVVMRLTEDIIINQEERLLVVNNSEHMEQMEFLMQYSESTWQFLRRLSYMAKENLYWTGSDLVFGTFKDFQTLEATYGKEITNFQSCSLHLPGEEEDEKTGPDAQTACIKGTSKTALPRIGRLLKIKMPETMSSAAEPGTFRITKTIHEYTRDGRYECEFEGIPAGLKYYPFLEVEIPVAVPEIGTVISNADPDGQGRVRVHFPFAPDSTSSAWLKVMSPNSDSTKKAQKNSGITFVPEPGDQVMIGFEHGDPSRPYVMGFMLDGRHGKNSDGNIETNASVSQEDYDDILKFRDRLYDNLDSIAKAVEIIKQDYDIEQQRMIFRMILETLLLVVQTEKGKKLFFNTLEYAKTIDPALSNEYWKIYDEQIDTILRSGYYKIKRK